MLGYTDVLEVTDPRSFAQLTSKLGKILSVQNSLKCFYFYSKIN